MVTYKYMSAMAMVTMLTAMMFVGCQAGPVTPEKKQQDIDSSYSDYSSKGREWFGSSDPTYPILIDGRENLVEDNGDNADAVISDGGETESNFFENMVYRNHELKAAESFTAPSQTAVATMEDSKWSTKKEYRLSTDYQKHPLDSMPEHLKTTAGQRVETGRVKISGVMSGPPAEKATEMKSKYADQRSEERHILSKKTDQTKTKFKAYFAPTRPSVASTSSTSSPYSSYASLAPLTTLPTPLSSSYSSSFSSSSSSYSSLTPHHRQKRFIGHKIRSLVVPLSIFNYLGYLPIRLPGFPYHIDPPLPDYTVYRAVHNVPLHRPYYAKRRRTY